MAVSKKTLTFAAKMDKHCTKMNRRLLIIRTIALVMMVLAFATDASAVLKEENLEKTLAILRNELRKYRHARKCRRESVRR